jgi:hypothetical protein
MVDADRSSGMDVARTSGNGAEAMARARLSTAVMDTADTTTTLLQLLTWLANCGVDAGAPPLLQSGQWRK